MGAALPFSQLLQVAMQPQRRVSNLHEVVMEITDVGYTAAKDQ